MDNNSVFEYMVEVKLPLPLNNGFISLIPLQREVVNKLMSDRIITSYAVSLEEGKIWTTIFAESVDEVVDILMEFPIINHVDYKISKLVFHNNISLALPQFSLN